MKGRRIQSPLTLQLDQLLVEFVRVNNIQDRMEYLSASETWLKKYNTIKSKIPEERKNEFVECENVINQKSEDIIRLVMLDEMENHAKGFKKQFDAYFGEASKNKDERSFATPKLNDIKRNYKSFVNTKFYKDFKELNPELAEKFENWMNNRFQREADAVLKKKMKEHVLRFRDKMAYLHDPDNAKALAEGHAPITLKDFQEQYEEFKQGEFYKEYKERFPDFAGRLDELIVREIQQEKESLAELRAELHSKLDALNVDVSTAKVKSNLNPVALSKLDEFNQSINVHKDLEKLESRIIYQSYSKALDQLEEALEKPNKKAPNWVGPKANPTERRKDSRHPMMGLKGADTKKQSESSQQSEPEVRPSRRSSTRGSTG